VRCAIAYIRRRIKKQTAGAFIFETQKIAKIEK